MSNKYIAVPTAVFQYLTVFIKISTFMYSFHCPSALNHLSLFSPQEKIISCSRTHTIFPWCVLTYYAYYVSLKQVVLGSTFIPQLWHTDNLHDDQNFTVQLTEKASRTLLYYITLGDNHWGQTFTPNKTSAFASQWQVLFYLHFLTRSLNNTAHHNCLHHLNFPNPIQPRCCCFLL